MGPDVEFIDSAHAVELSPDTRVVPITPTPKMISVGHREAVWGSGDVVKVWKAMLDAAPNASSNLPRQ